MTRSLRIAFIQQVAKQPNAFDRMVEELQSLPGEGVSDELLTCGIIPEWFAHDSSEEKLWAKYCDILLSMALGYLGLDARVIRTRGNSADVLGITDEYSVVGDAKAFRLSRTAKNQKDFKVSALDDWRQANTYACLVAPLYQFPAQTSQIYTQAEIRNVTLLSYVHLKFLLDFPPAGSLAVLWRTAGGLSPSTDARLYWDTLDRLVVMLTGQDMDTLRDYKRQEIERTTAIGHEGIAYWQTVIDEYQQLTQQQAVSRLIRAEKIEQKIHVIQSAIAKVQRHGE